MITVCVRILKLICVLQIIKCRNVSVLYVIDFIIIPLHCIYQKIHFITTCSSKGLPIKIYEKFTRKMKEILIVYNM